MATAKQEREARQAGEAGTPGAAATGEVGNVVVEETASIAPRRFFTIPGRDPFDEIEW